MFKFKNEKSEKIDLGECFVKIDCDIEQKYKAKMKVMNVKEEDLKYLVYFKNKVEENIECIVDNFYKGLVTKRELMKIINEHSSVDKLKVTLKKHIIEMFEGVIDNMYFEKRERIAKMHVHIGLKVPDYIRAFQELNKDVNELIWNEVKDTEDIRKMMKAFEKLSSLEQFIVLEEYEILSEKEKEKIEEEKRKLITNVYGVSCNLKKASELTSEGVETLNKKTKESEERIHEIGLLVNEQASEAQEGRNMMQEVQKKNEEIKKVFEKAMKEAKDLEKKSQEPNYKPGRCKQFKSSGNKKQ